MKKTIKGLIIAASVAAVVGVGAVSYAAWSGGTTASKDVDGSTGSINTVGQVSVEAKNGGGDITEMEALYPVDQGGSYLTYWQLEVTVTGEGDQTVTLVGTLSGGTGTTSNAALYYTTDKPVDSDGAEDESVTANGKPIASAQTLTMAESGATTIYVYMTAENTDAMNATVKLTFTATATNS